MNSILLTVALNFPFLFFSIYSIFGITYMGADQNLNFVYSLLIINIGSIYYVFKNSIFRNSYTYSKINIVFLLIPIAIILLYLFETQIRSHIDVYYFYQYIAFSLPATYIGIIVAKNKLLPGIIRWFYFVMLIITLSLVLSSKNIFTNNIISIGGSGYQGMSYMAGYSYAINLCTILFSTKYHNFKYFKTNTIKIIQYILLIVQIIFVLASTGRGGILLVLFSTIILFAVKYRRSYVFSKVALSTAMIAILFGVTLLILPQEVKTAVEDGAIRAFSYISYEGINMSKTSGRDIVWEETWHAINNKPILGYGVFYYSDKVNGAHNLILDILMQGGILYLLIWIIVLIKLFIKANRLIKQNDYNIFIIPISVYPFTMLLYSGQYMTSPLFWFSLAYIFNYKDEHIKSLNLQK